MADSTALQDILVHFARTLATDYGVVEILHEVVQGATRVLPVTDAGVVLRDDKGALTFVAATSTRAGRLETLQAELGEGPGVQAYQTGQQVLVADLRADGTMTAFVDQAGRVGLTAAFSFPLWHEGSQLGSLDLYAELGGGLDVADRVAAQVLADVATGYIVNARARDRADRAQRDLRSRATSDTLTGLANRRQFADHVNAALASKVRNGTQLAVLFIDVDHFKHVNDTLGHQLGDQLLMELSRRLQAAVRRGDVVSRFGGDEFGVLCRHPADASAVEVAVGLAERILDVLTEPFGLDGHALAVTVSIGVALAQPGDGPESLIGRADAAMYRAKGGGRARVELFDDTMQEQAIVRSETEVSLRGAVRRGELVLHYQPIFDAADGSLARVEALLRWQHPERGLCRPEEFLGLAEETGLIGEIGQWVLFEACRQIARWRQVPTAAGLQVSVNVSQRQAGPALLDAVTRALTRHDVPPEALCLEVTEAQLVADSESPASVLAALKALGVNIAIDDFGTGHSSLVDLRRFPVDALKVDRRFVSDLGHDPDQTLVRAMIGLAHSLGISVVAVGVESAVQLSALRGLGCDMVQGHLLGPPGPWQLIDEFVAYPGFDPQSAVRSTVA
ncbi:MAG: EAL domain-containing protein [Mycobacteriales bacterium]